MPSISSLLALQFVLFTPPGAPGLDASLSLRGAAAEALYAHLTGHDVQVSVKTTSDSQGTTVKITRDGAGVSCAEATYTPATGEAPTTAYACRLLIDASGYTLPGDINPIAGVGS